jgi:hypothetical protein
MIPRIQPSGSSFVGSGRYYLHDKAADKSLPPELKPKTDERVWFTDTRNLMATDPERAFVEMWRTAEDQQWLKRQTGGKTCGRVCEEPVKTLSLAWHKDDAPTPEHMVEAADAFMKHMGWQEHQAVYIGHDDTEHRHIHIVVNRVHPETGRTLDDFREYKRAQEWALAYEKEHDNVRCVERELRAAEREQRAPDFGRDDERTANPPAPDPANQHLPHNVVTMTRPHEQQFNAEEQARATLIEEERAELKAEQRAERESWFKDGKQLFKQTRHAVYDEVRKDYAPEWRQFYLDAKAAEQQAETWSRNAVTRALWFAAEGNVAEMLAAFSDRDAVRDDVMKELAERKAELKQRQNDDLRGRQKDACDALRLSRDEDYKELLQRQRDERAAMQAAHVQGQSAEFVLEARDNAPTPAAANEPVQIDPRAAAAELHQANNIADLAAGIAGSEPAPDGSPAVEPDALLATSPDSPVAAPDIAPTISVSESERTALSEHLRDTIASFDPLPGAGEAIPAEDFTRAEEVGPRIEPVRSAADLGAGAIGALASYLADELAELFAPTPPEQRLAKQIEEQQRVAAERKAEPEIPPPSLFDQIHAEAMREAERMAEEKRSRDYWTERDRGKEWDRDR